MILNAMHSDRTKERYFHKKKKKKKKKEGALLPRGYSISAHVRVLWDRRIVDSAAAGSSCAGDCVYQLLRSARTAPGAGYQLPAWPIGRRWDRGHEYHWNSRWLRWSLGDGSGQRLYRSLPARTAHARHSQPGCSGYGFHDAISIKSSEPMKKSVVLIAMVMLSTLCRAESTPAQRWAAEAKNVTHCPRRLGSGACLWQDRCGYRLWHDLCAV